MKAAQQGHADAMCGLYSILNFLQTVEYWREDEAQDGMFYLLETYQRKGWLTPHFLTRGFTASQLKSVLDDQIKMFRLGFVTHFLSDVIAAPRSKKGRELLVAIASAGGAVITGPKGGSHWQLVMSRQAQPILIDSDRAERPVRLLDEIKRVSVDHEGVVILPVARPVVEINI
ncbi:MAG: hypothetical protein KGQ52_13670 [Alphaproteobacteria bacterium]|nr:hypothetical protein [Alphaproteobacteria bacterium]